jgi:hypothetical protein
MQVSSTKRKQIPIYETENRSLSGYQDGAGDEPPLDRILIGEKIAVKLGVQCQPG